MPPTMKGHMGRRKGVGQERIPKRDMVCEWRGVWGGGREDGRALQRGFDIDEMEAATGCDDDDGMDEQLVVSSV
jgi:hypothetical protein